MAREYVERHEGGYRVAGTRVSLDSIVYGYLRGESAEGIAESYPAVTLEQVYGAIAYYLANREAVEKSLRESEAEFDRLREESRKRDPAFYARLAAAKRAAQQRT